MIRTKIYTFILSALTLYSCRWVETKEEQKTKEFKNMKAPIPEKVSFLHADDFDSRLDHYHWMIASPNQIADSTDETTSKIREHLLNENKYADAKQYEHTNLKEQLLKEFELFGKQKNEFHHKIDDYHYFAEFEKNMTYPILYRYESDNAKKKKKVIDFNKMSKEQDYFKLGEFRISPNHKYIAYSADTNGQGKYFINIIEISKNLTQATNIENSDGQIEWGKESKSIFIVENIRKGVSKNSSLYQYKFLEINKKKKLLLKERKGSIKWDLKKSKSGRFIFIYKEDDNTTTTYFIDLQKNQIPTLFRQTETGNSYYLGHQNQNFIIRSNRESSANFKVYKTQIQFYNNPEKWELLVGHREDAVIEAMEVFDKFIVLEEKVDGIKNFHILNSETGLGHYADFNEETYSVELKYNFDYFSNKFIYEYSSLSTPKSVFQYSAENRQVELLYRYDLEKEFEESKYKTERIWATSFDGQRIPISLIYKRTTKLDGKAPLLLKYEANYGETIDLEFNSNIFSLLDRDFVYAIAHLRGGGYLGQKWHTAAKGLKKSVAINDLQYAIRHLINQDFASDKKVFISAERANATIATSLINSYPEIVNGLILFNPKTDLLTSLFSEKKEFQRTFSEWGDPNNEKNYFSIKAISPYDNIRSGNYPFIFIQNDLFDYEVSFWESLKWVAKLRELEVGKNEILIDTDMEIINPYDQENRLNIKLAKSYAFLISLAGKS